MVPVYAFVLAVPCPRLAPHRPVPWRPRAPCP